MSVETAHDKLTLIDGRFAVNDAMELVSKLIDLKIGYHQSRIDKHAGSEENIKHSEKRISQLQQKKEELLARMSAQATNGTVDIEGILDLKYP